MKTEPHETLSGPLIVFDGVCVLCTTWLRFVIKHDRRGELRFATMQSAAGRELLRRHGLDPDDPVSFLVLVDGRPHSDSTAMIRVMSEFGGIWRIMKILHIVPRPIRDWIYRFVARHRYRLFGKHETCIIPDDEIRDRFVNDLADVKKPDAI